MKLLYEKNGGREVLLEALQKRSGIMSGKIKSSAEKIVARVKAQGDDAVREFSLMFDKYVPRSFEITQTELDESAALAPAELVSVMKKAAVNIKEYHSRQKSAGYEFTRDGRRFGRVVRPLERVGIYVPGGTAAYPSTILMNCIPAVIAGVGEIIMVTPPKKDGISPALAAAAKIAGVTRVFAIGGVQAVAALAYGTESIPRVDKIVGPGNAYVAAAKRIVYGDVDIDMIAGPSEVLVVADDSANSEWIAADMLSQLEHDPGAAAILLTNSERIAKLTAKSLKTQLESLERREIAEAAASRFAFAVIVDNITKALELANTIAPEHLELMCADAEGLLAGVKNAGSVFIGKYTTEPLGDYFAGTNHVLPTNGSARFASPLSVDDFVKKFSYLEYNKDAFLEDAAATMLFAESEGLTAHANAVKIRLSGKT